MAAVAQTQAVPAAHPVWTPWCVPVGELAVAGSATMAWRASLNCVVMKDAMRGMDTRPSRTRATSDRDRQKVQWPRLHDQQVPIE